MTPVSLLLSRGVIASALLAAASTATAQVFIDFESDNPFSGGTLSSDQSVSGSQSLFLDVGQTATFAISNDILMQAAQPGFGAVQITMEVYDMGKWIDRNVAGYPGGVYGARWGISTGGHTGAESVGASVMERSQVDSATAYGMPGAQDRFASAWHTVAPYGERVATLTPGTGGSNDGSGFVPGTGGEGAWGTWRFTVDTDGGVEFQLDDFAAVSEHAWITTNIGALPTEVWVFGGRNSTNNGLALSGVYLDNISITAVPEPSTYALMFGAVALGAVAWRRRKAVKAA